MRAMQAAALSRNLTDLGLNIVGLFSRMDASDAKWYNLVSCSHKAREHCND